MLTTHNRPTYAPGEVRTRAKGASSFSSWTVYEPSFLVTYDYLRKLSTSSPGFKELKRSQLQLNEFSFETWTARFTPTTGTYDYFFNDGETSSHQWRGPALVLDSYPAITESDRPNLESVDFRAQMKLFENLDQTKGSALVTLAEIDKTAKMIADTAKQLAGAFLYLKNGNLGKAATMLGAQSSGRKSKAYRAKFKPQASLNAADVRNYAGNAWLGLSYGWKPLISDIYSQAENLANYLTHHQGIVRTARGQASSVKITRRKTNYPVGTWNVHTTVKCLRRRSYVCFFTLAEGGDSFANVFGLKNPAILAWELLPFSFVVDWFLPVGNFLQSFSATNGLVFHSGVSATKQSDAGFADIVPSTDMYQGPDYVRKFSCTGGRSEEVKYYKYRNVLHDFPSPRLPQFKNPVSISHAISAIALLQAVMSGKPNRPSSNSIRI